MIDFSGRYRYNSGGKETGTNPIKYAHREAMTMKKIRVAQIGIGHDHASGIFNAMWEMSDEVELVGYCTTEDDVPGFLTDRTEEYHGKPVLTLEEILADKSLDAITVETVDSVLTKYAKMALDAGFPVHMDKPGGIDQTAFEEMCDTAKAKGLPLSLGYMYRFNPALREFEERYKAGEFGDILYVNAEMSCYHKPWKRNWLANYPGGMMYFLGCHLVDLIYRLQGEPLEVIPMNAKSGLDGATGIDNAFAAFRYPKGTSFARTSATERGGYRRRNVLIVCENGTFELRPTEYRSSDEPGADGDLLKTDYRHTADPAWRANGEMQTTEEYHRYKNMLRAFFSSVQNGTPLPCTPDYEKRLHKVLLQACGEEK